MSGQIDDESARLARTVVPLFKDFSARLAQTRKDAMKIYTELRDSQARRTDDAEEQNRNQLDESRLRSQLYAIQNSSRSFNPAMEKLARQVSQHLQHDRNMDDLVRIELEARLAAFENDIHLTREYIDSFMF